MIGNVKINRTTLGCFFNKFLSDNGEVEELTVMEIAKRINVLPDTVRKRITRRQIEPLRRVGPIPVYSPDVIELVKEDLPRGRPRKPKPDA
jgi:hypothetical protein